VGWSVLAESLAELKERILKLLEEDREFRFAEAGLIGLREILERLDKHEEQFEGRRDQWF